jgi:beta-lactamase class A
LSESRIRELLQFIEVAGKPLSQQLNKITSGYGARKAPVPGASTFHPAIDFGFPTGTPIKFLGQLTGIKIRANSGKSGNLLELVLPTGETIQLLHLQKFGNVSNVPVNNPIAPTSINTKGLQSLLVTELQSGKVLQSFNSNKSPASPASTIKLIIADIVTKAIESGKLKLDQSIPITSDIIAQGGSFGVGNAKLSTLLQAMLAKSDNTAANALIKALGGISQANQLAKQSGYTNTTIGNYLSIPGNTAFLNKSTAEDTTRAIRNLLLGNTEADKIASQALHSTRNFNFRGEVGGKIGNNSKVIGNVGIVNINGKEYIVTAYANINGNVLNNRGIITNVTNDVVRQLSQQNKPASVAIPAQSNQGTSRQNALIQAANMIGL